MGDGLCGLRKDILPGIEVVVYLLTQNSFRYLAHDFCLFVPESHPHSSSLILADVPVRSHSIRTPSSLKAYHAITCVIQTQRMLTMYDVNF